VGNQSDGDASEAADVRDPIEVALAEGLRKAAEAGQWTAVELLSRELQARREARANVVELDAERRRRR
jgi:hypothetical protein